MTDHELRVVLKELLSLRSEGEPVVTLYLDTCWNDEKQRERARVFVRERAKEELDAHEAHPQRERLERTLRRIVAEAGDRVTQPVEGHAKGLAIFACESLNLWKVVGLPHHTIQSKLCTGMRPQLLPLARLLDDVETAMIAVIHLRGARVYEVALGGVVAEATVEGPLPRSYKAGFQPRPALGRMQVPGNAHGTGEGFQYERSQKNQRHYDNVAERNRSVAAEFVAQRFDQRPCHVVLVGPREVCAAFERALPQRVQERIIARRPAPAGAGDGNGRDQLLDAALKCLAQKEREQENEAIELALGQAKRGGLAVLGPDEVVLAVNERRVHRLILEEDFTRSGWMCRNCNAIGVNHADKCTYCNGELAWVKELGEEIATRVMADDGDVEVVQHDRRLHSFHGVAAMLRQARGGFGANEARAPRA
jgi:peptide subunit release factor 1 (eRF1)